VTQVVFLFYFEAATSVESEARHLSLQQNVEILKIIREKKGVGGRVKRSADGRAAAY
jgi:hypothetical protein